MPPFVPAAQLCRDFYADVLEPALAGIHHSAALLGHGSDVLGYDTKRSTDHDWGPRAQIFLAADDRAAARVRLERALPATTAAGQSRSAATALPWNIT